MRFSFLLLVFLVSTVASAQTGVATNYAVTTAGDTLRTDVEFKDPMLATSYVMVAGERREIEEFSSLYLDGVTNAVVDGRRLAPLLNDGDVRFYARTVSTPGGMMPTGPNGTMMMTGGTSRSIGYIQVGSGPVLKATHGALSDALSGNPQSVQHLGRARTYRTANWVATGLGVVAMASGVYLMIDRAKESDSGPSFHPVFLGGVALAGGGGYIFRDLADTERNKAIDAYNAE